MHWATRTWWAAGIAALWVWALSGCAVVEPLRLLELSGTSWRVESVGGTSVGNSLEAHIRFTDNQHVTVSSECGRSSGEYFVDTSSDLLEFSAFDREPTPCDADAAATEERLLDAIASIQRWQVHDEGPN